MMGRRPMDRRALFYAFDLDAVVPKGHLLRRIGPFVSEVLRDLHAELAPF